MDRREDADEWKEGEPCYVDGAGRRWMPFAITFDADERQFSFALWAVSREHAVLLLADLISTARITGRVVHTVG